MSVLAEAPPEPCRRVVLTGGPGAGKTAVLELAKLHVCEHVAILPESASMLFRGGFPRLASDESLRAAQRAIYHVQHELELAAASSGALRALVCDRGTIDGSAYWPGPDTLWSAVASDQGSELSRYYAAIHLRVPDNGAYNHSNPVRIESAVDAARIDQRIADAWRAHPRRFEVRSAPHFMAKAYRALALLFEQLPLCCSHAQAVRELLARSLPAIDALG